MTKKGKLVGTIVVLIFIAIMIPVAIFATQNNTLSISNIVKYQADYLDGVFYYAVTGNKIDKSDGTSSYDIGYTPSSGTITPSLLFTASYDDANDQDIITVGQIGTKLSDESIAVENNGLEFSKTEKVISYYFIYANTAKTTLPLDDRNVIVTATVNSSLPSHVNKQWSYYQGTTSSNTIFTTFTNTAFSWTSNDENITTGLVVEDKETDDSYHYLILKFTLTLEEEIAFDDAEISITVTISDSSI